MAQLGGGLHPDEGQTRMTHSASLASKAGWSCSSEKQRGGRLRVQKLVSAKEKKWKNAILRYRIHILFLKEKMEKILPESVSLHMIFKQFLQQTLPCETHETGGHRNRLCSCGR